MHNHHAFPLLRIQKVQAKLTKSTAIESLIIVLLQNFKTNKICQCACDKSNGFQEINAWRKSFFHWKFFLHFSFEIGILVEGSGKWMKRSGDLLYFELIRWFQIRNRITFKCLYFEYSVTFRISNQNKVEISSVLAISRKIHINFFWRINILIKNWSVNCESIFNFNLLNSNIENLIKNLISKNTIV